MLLKYFRSLKSDIDFDKIESNEHGLFVPTGRQVNIDGARKVITVIFPVHFFPDVLDLQAELWPDRRGMYVKVPSVLSALSRMSTLCLM